MALSDILLKLVIDSGESKGKLTEITNEINSLKSAVEKSGGVINIFTSSFKEAFKEVFNFNDGIKTLIGTNNNYEGTVNKINNSQRTVNKSFEEGATNIDKQITKTQNYTNTINTLETSIKGGVKTLQANNTAIQGNIKELNTQTTSVQAETTAIKTNTTAVQTHNTAIQAQNVYIRNIVRDQNDATNSSINLKNVIWELYYAFRGLAEGVKLALGISFTEWSREFEKNMYNMQSIALETVGNFNFLKESIINISKENNYSGLVGLSDALYQAYSSGFKMADAIDLVKEADRGALAGLANTKDVLEALVTVMHSYGMSTDQASKVNDIFLKTVQDGVITMPQLSRYIGQATTIAPELGIALEDVAGGFVAMTRQGLNAAETTTALNAVMKTFLDPSQEALKYAKEMGINLSKSAFDGKNFADVIKDIAQKGDVDLMGKIFGNVRGLKGFFKLAKDDGDKFVQYIENIKNSTGSVDKAIEQQRKSFDQKVTQLKNTWEIFMQSIGELTQTLLTPIIEVVTDLIKTFNNLPNSVKVFVGLLSIGGSVVAGFTTFIFALKQALLVLGAETLASKLSIDVFTASIGFSEVAIVRLQSALMRLIPILGWATIAYGAYKTAQYLNDKRESDQTISENQQVLEDIRRLAETKIKKYERKTSLNQPLTNDEKGDYAKALMQYDANNPKNRALAKQLATEYGMELENNRKINEAKEKMTKETADKNMKIRAEYEKEKTEGTIDNLIFEATHSEYQVKLAKKSKEYDDKINLLKQHAQLPNNVSSEEAKQDLEQAKALEIAKQQELAKLRVEYAEKEVEKRRAYAEKIAKIEYKNQGYDIKLKGQNYQENLAKLDFSKTGDDTAFEKKLIDINTKRKAIYDSIANNKKLTQDIRDDAELKALQLKIDLQKDFMKLTEESVQKNVANIKEVNSLIMQTISHNASLGKITKQEQYSQEIGVLSKESFELMNQISKLPKGSKELEKLTKDLKETNLKKDFKQEEKDKDFYNSQIADEQRKNQVIADNNETLHQLKLKNDRDYLNAKIDMIDAEIALEKKQLTEANDDKKKEINAKIEALENKKNLAESSVKKYDNDIIIKLNKQRFDDEKKEIDELKNLKLVGDLYVYRASLDNIAKYITFLKTQKTSLETKGQGKGGKIGGKLGSEEWQQVTQQLKDAQSQQLQIIYNTNQEIIKADNDLLKAKIDNLNLYSSAFSKVGETLLKVNSDIAQIIGSTLREASNSFQQILSFSSKAQPILEKIDQNNSSKNQLQSNLNVLTSAKNIDRQKVAGIMSEIGNKTTENSALQGDLTNMGISMAIEQVSKSLDQTFVAYEKTSEASNKYANVLKAFPKDSKEAKEAGQGFTESLQEYTKALPVVGETLAKVQRAITDFFGATKSEKSKKEDKEIADSYLNLAKTKASIESTNFDNKVNLMNMEKDAEKTKAVQSISNADALSTELYRIDLEYSYKKTQLYGEQAKRIAEIDYNLQVSIRGIYQDTMQAKIEDSIYLYNKQLADISLKYNLSNESMFISDEQKKELDTAKNQKAARDTKLFLDNAKIVRNAQYELEKSQVNLMDDSLTKTLKLLEIDQRIALSNKFDEYKSGSISYDIYLQNRQTILNDYQKKQNDSIIENNNKIKAINEKDYNEELKAIETVYGKKTNKIKSELDAQINIINDYNQKVKDLEAQRNQDQTDKTTRAKQFNLDIISTQNRLQNNGAFFQQNQTAFDIGNGLNTGNETERTKIENDFARGLITLEQRSQKHQKLALEKYTYYQAQLTQEQDPEKRRAINSKITEATSEYYDFIFDKEKEKLKNEQNTATQKIKDLKTQLVQEESLQAEQIKKLDTAYKTASGEYKDSFVNATDDWIKYARQQTIEKLGVDSFNLLQGVGNNLAKNKLEASKLSTIGLTTSTNNPIQKPLVNSSFSGENITQGINLTQPSTTSSSIASNVISKSIINNSTAASINPFNPYQPLNANQTQSTSMTSGNGTNKFKAITPALPQTYDEQMQMKVTLLDKIRANGFFGASEYNNLFDKPLDVIITRMQELGMPLYAKGGVTPNGQPVIAGEAGREFIFTETDAWKIYSELKNPSYINNNSSSHSNVTIQNYVSVSVASNDDRKLTDTIKSVVNDRFELLNDKIMNNLNGLR